MARHIGWILAAALFAAPAAAPAEPVAGPQHDQQKDSKQNERRPRFVKWWAEAEPRAEIGISDLQAAAIEKIWQAHMPAQRQRYSEHEKLEPALARLIKEGTADPDLVAREVERVETLAAEIRSARISMIYRMQHQLTADQRARLKVWDDRRRQSERKSAEPGRRD
jgi:Spy/CpxP family protein refolding chaperone